LLIEMPSARLNAMDFKKLMLPFAVALVLSGCGGHLVGPSSGTEASTSGLSSAMRTATRRMSVKIMNADSFPDAKYVRIFDNLARRPAGKYWGGAPFAIVGGSGNSEFTDDQFAAAFTPSANHTATMIEAAIVNSTLGYGSAGFSLSVNQDDNGVPGTALITAQLPALPQNYPGLCCAMVIGTIPSGLALTGGTQYWLVLNGQGALATDGAGWEQDDTDQVHPFLDAVYCAYASKCANGPGWYTFEGDDFGTGAAFAVLGSN
jgi:hypothetical protein